MTAIGEWSPRQRDRWITKCFRRREIRRLGKSSQTSVDSLPWHFVQRRNLRWDQQFHIASWNVRSMASLTAKELIVNDLQRHHILIACLQECRWDVEEIGSKCGDYKLWGGVPGKIKQVLGKEVLRLLSTNRYGNVCNDFN